MQAIHRAGPVSVMGERCRSSVADAAKPRRRRPRRSSAISAMTINNMRQAICAAPARLPRLSQVVKIDSVRVCTPRYSLAPMSLSVSSKASNMPTLIARRASGTREFPRSRAEHARGLGDAWALSLKHRARGEINVGIEHETEEENRTGERADVRKPIVRGGVPAENRSQRRLYRPERVENVDIDVSHDVGRDRKRQRQ